MQQPCVIVLFVLIIIIVLVRMPLYGGRGGMRIPPANHDLASFIRGTLDGTMCNRKTRTQGRMHRLGGSSKTEGVLANVMLCDAGPEELQGYLEALMGKLLEVVGGGDADTQETALGAIASAANAAGSSFQPYVSAVFPVLRQYMEVPHPSLFLVF